MTEADTLPIHLVADVGGTHARFAWIDNAAAQLQDVKTYNCDDYGQIDTMIKAYQTWLRQNGNRKQSSLCLAVAAPVTEDVIKLTNRDWQFTCEDLAIRIGMPVLVLNDFAAQAHMLRALQDDDLDWVQCPAGFGNLAESSRLFRTVVGPGTGFGAASLTPAGEVVNSEPGHCSFAPVNDHEIELLKVLRQRYGRVSNEHLLSGPGLENLFWANSRLAGGQAELDAPAIVSAAGDSSASEHEHARRAICDFIGIAGSVCGDIALGSGCRGGLFLSGSMLEKMGRLFDHDLFVQRFRDKGPFSDWCAEIPVARLLPEQPGLLGCARFSASRHRLPCAVTEKAVAAGRQFNRER